MKKEIKFSYLSAEFSVFVGSRTSGLVSSMVFDSTIESLGTFCNIETYLQR